MAQKTPYPVLAAIFGLSRAGRILYGTLFVLAVPALAAWFILLPRLRFSDRDERLFKAARHGDAAGIARAIAEGADVNVEAPIDRKTALFRAAAFAQADAVRALLKAGADAEHRGADNQTALQLAETARKEEHDPSRASGYDQVIAALRGAQR